MRANIYARLYPECCQAVLSGCQDLVHECRGKAKMAYELGAVSPEEFNELWKALARSCQKDEEHGQSKPGEKDFVGRMKAYTKGYVKIKETECVRI